MTRNRWSFFKTIIGAWLVLNQVSVFAVSTQSDRPVGQITRFAEPLWYQEATGFSVDDPDVSLAGPDARMTGAGESVPTVTATVASDFICSGTATNITLSGSIPATNFSWTAVQYGASGASSGSGNSILQTLNATGAIAGEVIYTITPEYEGTYGTPIDVSIFVKPKPTATATPTSQSICSGETATAVLTGTVPGTTFTWSVLSVTRVTEVKTGDTGSGSVIVQNFTNYTTSAGTVVYQVIATANGCSNFDNPPTFVFITVYPLPTPGAISGDQAICPGETPATITSVTEGTGSAEISYIWEKSTDGVNWTQVYGGPNADLDPPVVFENTQFRRITVSTTSNGKACYSEPTAPVTIYMGGDDLPPTFTVPAPATVPLRADCTASTGPAVTGFPYNIFDNCSDPSGITVEYEDSEPVPGACPGTYSFVRTWTVTDETNLSSSQDQTITVIDQTKPILSIPPTAVVDCSGNTGPAFTGQATATDNCGGTVLITYTDDVTAGSCPQNLTILRNWTATDCSGNSVTAIQTILARDTQKPEVFMQDLYVQCPGDIPPAYTNLAAFIADGNTVSDNCGSVSFIVFDEIAHGLEEKPGYCPNRLTRYYRVTDGCGNDTEVTQEIYIADECGCSPCLDGVNFFFVDMSNDPYAEFTVPSTIRNGTCCDAKFNDRCIAFNIILHKDAIGIEISINGATPQPHEWDVDCRDVKIINGIVCLPTGQFHLFTFCKPGANPEDYTFRSVPGVVAAEGITTRMECSQQLFTEGIENQAMWNSVWPGTPGQYNHYLSSLTDPNPFFYADVNSPPVIKYEVCGYIGTNSCNDLGMDCDTITVNVRPLIELAWDNDPTMVCEDDIPPLVAQISPIDAAYQFEWFNGYDAVGTPIYTGSNSYTPDSDGQYSIRVTDLDDGVPCGSKVFNFDVIYDTTPASVFGPPDGDLTVECNGPTAYQEINNWLNSAYALDDDGSSIPVYWDYSGINMACGTSLPVTFLATDKCGNEGSAVAYIHVIDTQAPNISRQAQDGEAECFGNDPNDNSFFNNWLATRGGATASDDCDRSLTWTNNYDPLNWSGNPCDNRITVTFFVTDDCNNTSQTVATFTVTDTQPPIIASCPPPVIGEPDDAECYATNVALGTPSAVDLCSSVTWTNNAPAQFPVGQTVVTWTASDACGNKATCLQNVNIYDNNQPPTIVCPPDVTATAEPGDCDVPVTSIEPPIADDNCGIVLQIWMMTGATTGISPRTGINDVNGQVFNVGTTVVTYTVADQAGNRASCSFTVTVEDQTNPVIETCPDDLTANAAPDQCEQYLLVPQPDAYDPCGQEITITHDSPYGISPNDASGNYPVGVTVITWTVTDSSGNSTTCTQTITVNDVQAPELTCPSDQEDTAEPGDCFLVNFEMPDPVYSDNCPNPILTYTMSGATTGSGAGSVSGFTFNVGVTTVTYTVTDASNNSTSCSFNVWVKDLLPPELTNGCPDDILGVVVPAGECEVFVNVPAPEVTDPCNEGYTVTNSHTGTADASGLYPVGTTTVIWTITDASGNITTCELLVEVIDHEAPVITFCPENVEQTTTTDNCELESVYMDDPVYTNNCSTPVLTYEMTFPDGSTASGNGSVSGMTFPVGVTTVIYTVTNSSGVSITCSFTVWIKDLVKPEFTYGCPDPIGPFDAAPGVCEIYVPIPTPEVYDPCNEGYTIINSYTGTNDASGIYPVGTTTIIWTVTDASGNENHCEQTVTVVDNEDPVWAQSMPADTTVECDDIPLIPADITATDNCDIQVDVRYDEERTDGPCADTYTLTRNWIATDEYGNTITHIQTITVTDTQAPVWAVAMPADITVECSEVPAAPANITATDNCDGDVQISYAEIKTNEDAGCAGSYTLIRSWTADDNCGNVSVHTQTITVTDTQAPVWAVAMPADITVECDEVPAAPANITATDNCDGDVQIIYSEIKTNEDADCAGSYTLIRSWTADDNCGNISVHTQTITVRDTQAPVWAVAMPADITVECDEVPAAPANITATDNCDGDVQISYSEIKTNEDADCAGSYTLIRSWTADDNCGNISVHTQTITVTDTQAPVWAVAMPADITVECDEVPAAPANITATDNCDGDVQISYSEIKTNEDADCAGSYTLIRSWTADDNCGNVSVHTQTITVTDTQAPVWAVAMPADITVECDEVPAAPANITATDNCDGDVQISYSEIKTNEDADCAGSYTLIRSWTADDNCGNVTVHTQTITVTDTQTPVWAVAMPADITVECDEVPAAPANITATDNCDGDVQISYAEIKTNEDAGCAGSYTLIRSWTADDNCGNISVHTQTITVRDTQAPVWAVAMPADITVECSEVPAAPANITATDNCDGDVQIIYSEIKTDEDAGCAGSYTLIRSWTADDNCGNISVHTQTITVTDTQAPVWAVAMPADITVECSEVPAAPANITATDNCDGDVQIIYSEIKTNEDADCAGSYTLIRSWTADDNCGNISVHTQTITVRDTQAPVWAVAMPADITVECDEVPAAPANITATDNCDGDVQISYSEIKTNEDADCAGSYTLIRSWTADDNCGNISVHTQTITVRDTQAPVWAVAMPADITVECDEVPAAPANITATDNCDGDVQISYAEIKTNEDADCAGSYTLIRSWTADDNCGNISVHTQTITVTDTQAPVWAVSMPADITVECDEVPAAPANITATDNCDGDVQISYAEIKTNEDAGCAGSYTLIRSWTADDNCGNISVHTQTITVTDTQAPVWAVAMPADITVECSEVPAAPANITATDNCDGDVQISYAEIKTDEDAGCAGSYTLIRSWTADDNCGNVSVHTQTITVTDTQAPVWAVSMPADITVECSEVPAAPANITATDNCDGDVQISYAEIKTDEDAGCAGSYTLIRSWTADDNCGNISVHTQTITVRDTQAPVWAVAMPADITVECDEVPAAPANITATDNCDGDVQISYAEIKTNEDAGCAGSYTLIRSWTADDNCGNISVHTQTITVTDTQAPVWAVAMPADITVECSEVPAAPANITATDNCDGDVQISYSEIKTNEDAGCAGSYTLIRSWTADDNCGNISMHTQTITVIDTQAPVWAVSMPADITVECSEVPAAPANITATDNCDGDVQISYAEIKTNEDAGCAGSYTLIRSWTADDNCGNVSVHTQTITVRDTQAPVWAVAMPADITVECDEVPAATDNITATDNCDGDVQISYAEIKTDEDAGCAGSYTLIRSWTADDNCGNISVHTQTITVRDTQAPVWAVAMPADITVECDEVPAAPANITATDNCDGDVQISYAEIKTDEDAGCAGSYTLIRSWTADDNCGNISVHTQTITVTDTQAPVWAVSMPADITVECDEVPAAPANITATDNCDGDVQISYAEIKTNEDAGCAGSYTLIRSWTADDNCGNISVHTQTITVTDTQAPVWAVAMPADITVECSEVPAAPANITATDNCDGDVQISYSEIKTDEDAGCAGSYTLIRSWTADDNCGNVSVHTQTITVTDTQAPVWAVSMPADITVECSEVPAAPANITATDNCDGDVQISYAEIKTDEDAGCAGSYTLIRSWTADDNCGNISVHTQTITVRDTQAPVWAVAMPADITVECDEVPAAPANITATDNCDGDVQISYAEIKTNEDAGCAGSYTLIRSWTADDNCGNISVHTQTITVRDTQAPVWAVAMPADITVECDEVPAAPANITATDNCDGDVQISYAEIKTDEDAGCAGSYTLIRSWTADDNCGNVSVHTQTITVTDTQAPVWAVSMPADITVECDEVPAAPANITATDNCDGDVQISYAEIKTNEDAGCAGSYTLIRSWTADDNCGNISVHTQTITVTDTQAPVWAVAMPADITVECSEVPAAPANITATDNCDGDVQISYAEIKTDEDAGCAGSYTLIRSWTADDNCGNVSVHTQTITVTDTQAPVWAVSMPADITVECSEVPAAPANITATDNCDGDVQISYAEIKTDEDAGCAGSYTLIRSWTADDNCGNISVHTQTITVRDTQAPVWAVAMPADITVECDEVPAAPANITATDNCDGDVQISYAEIKTNEDAGCAGSYTLIRSWTADDNCGNISVHTQTITVTDTQAPVWAVAMPADITVECSEVPAAPANITATDNCDGDVQISYAEIKTNEDAGCAGSYTLIRSWTADDNCGNISMHTQTITVIDTQAPVWAVSMPADITVECSEVPAAPANITATDNCDGDVQISYAEIKTNEDAGCAGSYTLIRSWTADDNCGNVSVHTQTITVRDTQAPVMDPSAIIPEGETDMDLCFGAIPEGPAVDEIAVLYTDNCSNDIVVTKSGTPSGNDCSWTVTYVYHITDGCGNAAEDIRITYSGGDKTNPVMTCPAALTAVCDLSEQPAYANFAEFTAAGGFASDNCAVDPASFKLISEISDHQTCPETVTRTYELADYCGNTVSCEQTITIDPRLSVLTYAIPENTVVDACNFATQADLDQAFAQWLASFTVSGGCSPDVVFSTNMAPQLCAGGLVTVVMDVTDLCGNLSVQATFELIPSPELTVEKPDNMTADACNFSSQAELNTAFAQWISGFSVGGGCSPNSQFSTTTAPDLCTGGTVTVVMDVTDLCMNTSVNATFELIPAPELSLSQPSDTTVSTCNFTSQSELDALFAQWLTGFAVAGGCSPNSQFSTTTAPDLCTGGTVTVVMNVTDLCVNTSVQANFILTPPAELVVSKPSNTTVSTCAFASQAELDAAFAEWMNGFTVTGGCNPVETLSSTTAPGLCGGSVTVTMLVSDVCRNESVSASYTVNPPSSLPQVSDINIAVNACDYAGQESLDNGFAAWIAGIGNQINLSGGCNRQLTNDLASVLVPDLCTGGTAIVNWMLTDLCDTTIFQSRYTVNPAPALSVTKPADQLLSACNFTSQQELDRTFTQWMSEFRVSGGCHPVVSLSQANAPELCVGGTVNVTLDVTDLCDTISVNATFELSPAPALIVSQPADTTINACDFVSQAELNTTFAQWLSRFGHTGGCNPVGNYGTPSAPDICGGSVTVTYHITDLCETASAGALFTINPPTQPEISLSATLPDTLSCSEADAYRTAPDATYTNGETGACLLSGAVPAKMIPAWDKCSGGIITVEYTATDKCGFVLTETHVITVLAAPAPVVTLPALPDTLSCDQARAYTSAPNANYTNNETGTCMTGGSIQAKLIPEWTKCDGGFITVEYAKTDDCGYEMTVSHVITVLPAPEPSVSLPGSLPASLTWKQAETYTSAPNATYSNYESGACLVSGSIPAVLTAKWDDCNGGIITVDYTATDECGFELSISHIITVEPAPEPTAFAGNRQIICLGDDIFMSDATAANYSRVSWTTSGDGSFVRPDMLNPRYLPGPEDIATGAALLTLTAQNMSSNCEAASSVMELFIIGQDKAQYVTSEVLCEQDLPYSWYEHTIQRGGTYESKIETPDGCYDLAILHLEVVPDNIAPEVVDDSYVVEVNTTRSMPVLENDFDPNGMIDPTTIRIVDNPRHGMVSVNQSFELVYTPSSNFMGKDQFSYSVCDDGDPCNVYCGQARVNIDILPPGQDKECEFFIPDGFSPNGDGLHDYFQIYCIQKYPDAKLMIFDKQGNQLYEKKNYGNQTVWRSYEEAHWNGESTKHHQNSRRRVEPGVYLYILDRGNGELDRGFVMVSY
ncbi:HYR domain-containing protein [Gaoshiqia sp. Z1-71]|uniref:HYR-like domain-containing protein n=1 Tax=Gaoshiqia hydrogeniformans TaxID=3290090 RepID=UPI003BF8DF06